MLSGVGEENVLIGRVGMQLLPPHVIVGKIRSRSDRSQAGFFCPFLQVTPLTRDAIVHKLIASHSEFDIYLRNT